MECDDKKIAKIFVEDRLRDVHFKTEIPNAYQSKNMQDDVSQIVNRMLSIAKEILGLSERKVPIE